MKHISTGQFSAFVDALQKEAGIGSWLSKALVREAPGAPLRVGRQLMLGSGLGAAAGAATADPDDRFRGAVRGALVGGGLTAGGQLLHSGARAQHLQSAKNLFERTMYGLTGHGLEHYPDPVARAQEIGVLRPMPKTPNVPMPGDLKKPTVLQTAAVANYNDALKGLGEDIKAFKKGYTNLPGLVHGLVSAPGDVLGSAYRRMSKADLAWAGLGLAGGAKEMFTPTQEGGPGKAERVLTSVGGGLGGALSPAGFIPAMATTTLAAKAGKGMGRLIDRFTAKDPQQEQPQILSQQWDTNGLMHDPAQVPVGG